MLLMDSNAHVSLEQHRPSLHSPVAAMAKPRKDVAGRDSDLPKTRQFFYSFSSSIVMHAFGLDVIVATGWFTTCLTPPKS